MVQILENAREQAISDRFSGRLVQRYFPLCTVQARATKANRQNAILLSFLKGLYVTVNEILFASAQAPEPSDRGLLTDKHC